MIYKIRPTCKKNVFPPLWPQNKEKAIKLIDQNYLLFISN